MLSGQYPALPKIPNGMDHAKAIREKNNLLEMVQNMRSSQSKGLGAATYEDQKKRLLPALTPWQRQLLPILEKQINAEELAANGRSNALMIDVAAQTAGALTGHLAGGLVSRTIGRLAAGKGAQLLEQSVVQALERGGVQQGVKTGLAQAGAER
jgi:hypothetical protein